MKGDTGISRLWQKAITVKVLPGLILGGVFLGIFLAQPENPEYPVAADIRFFMGVAIIGLFLILWIISHTEVEDAVRRRQAPQTGLLPPEQLPVEIKVDDKVIAQLAHDVGLLKGLTSSNQTRIAEVGGRAEELRKQRFVEHPEINALYQDVGALKQGLSAVEKRLNQLDRSSQAASQERATTTPLHKDIDAVWQALETVEKRLEDLSESVPARAEDRRPVDAQPWRPPSNAGSLSGQVKEQLSHLSAELQNAYETPERARGAFVMAPFWWACADGLEQAALKATQRWKEELAGQADAIARAAIGILQGAVTALGQEGYRVNVNLMRGVFFSGGRPIDETVEDMDKDFVEVLREISPRDGFVRVAEKITDIKARLSSGDVALHLGSASTAVMEARKLESRHSPEGMAAWTLVGYAMAKYMDRHLGKYLVQR